MTRATRTSTPRSRGPVAGEPVAWWSGARPPWEEWPGVSIRLDAVAHPDGRPRSPCGKYWFDAAAADRVCGFFRDRLFHYKGAHQGRPFDPLPWQRDLVLRPAFGWRRVDDGTRRFRTVFVLVPKKNGKSMLASGVGLYLLGPDGEPGAEVYSVAKDRPQASIVFQDAAELARNSPALMRRYDVFKTSIVFMRRRSSYRVLDGRAAGNHGWNIHGLLFDEFHEQEDTALFDVLRFGSLARRQPLHLFISTAGTDLETPCGAEYERAKEVIAGSVQDERYLPVVFEAPKEMDWTAEETWRRANPSLGHTITVEDLRSECEEAKRRPSKRNAFLQLLLNRWGETREPWISVERWDEGELKEEPRDLGELVACVGVDLSSTKDLTAVALLFRRPCTRKLAVDVSVAVPEDEPAADPRLIVDFQLYVKTYFWIPQRTLAERLDRERLRYDEWIKSGHLNVTAGGRVDYRAVRREVLALKKRYRHLREVAVDPWNATDFNAQLQEDGVTVVEVRQGYRTLTAPSKLFEAMVMEGLVTHDGNPCMRWCVGNTELGRDTNDNIRPLKPKERWRRIDGVAALLTGLSRLMVLPGPARRPRITAVG